MNIAYFLIPKKNVAYLYDDYTFRQGLEKMRHHKYTAIPVIDRNGKYVDTVSEGDFLWYLLSKSDKKAASKKAEKFDKNAEIDLSDFSWKQLEQLQVRDILRGSTYSPVRITVSVEELLQSAMNQNFIPVVDDLDSFIGIVTRKDIIRHFAYQKTTTANSKESRDLAEPRIIRTFGTHFLTSSPI